MIFYWLLYHKHRVSELSKKVKFSVSFYFFELIIFIAAKLGFPTRLKRKKYDHLQASGAQKKSWIFSHSLFLFWYILAELIFLLSLK